ncbi:hypothetical protein DFH09DRAFT_1278122 [Mycena vulgaris]|nr:hypothetical protein DFH09DRAFT_1278122 [Mycena vulgaris]
MDRNDKQEDWNNKDNKNLEQEDNKRMKIEWHRGAGGICRSAPTLGPPKAKPGRDLSGRPLFPPAELAVEEFVSVRIEGAIYAGTWRLGRGAVGMAVPTRGIVGVGIGRIEIDDIGRQGMWAGGVMIEMRISREMERRLENDSDRTIESERSSKPTASAQPMSRSLDFHPGSRRQARHLPRMTIATPVPELASEKAEVANTSQGPGIRREMMGRERTRSHHERSSIVPRGGVGEVSVALWPNDERRVAKLSLQLLDVFEGLPRITEGVGDPVDVGHAVRKKTIMWRAGGTGGKVKDGESHVFVEFLDAIIWQNIASTTEAVACLAAVSSGFDANITLEPAAAKFCQKLTPDAQKAMMSAPASATEPKTPQPEDAPNETEKSKSKLFSDVRITAAVSEMERNTSAASDPGGRRQTDGEKAVKVPHVHGKMSESMWELMEE